MSEPAKTIEGTAQRLTVVAPAPLTPMDMIERAVTQGAGFDVIEKLMSLQERWEKNQARKAFDAAIAAAKAELPVIVKNRTVDFTSAKGRTNYKHEDFAEIVRTVDPILAKHGLSHRFRTDCQPDRISVTCILSHRDGYSEENTLIASHDLSGNKNSIQAIGSAQTYLQRYTLKAALGLAASDDDDVKAAADPEFISAEQATALETLIKETGGDVAKFCAWAKVESLSAIFAGRYEAAVTAIKRAGEDRKKAARAKQ